MKRNAFWGLLCSLVIVALLLPACGGKATEAPPAEPVEVIWYVRTNDSEQPWEQNVVIPDLGQEPQHQDQPDHRHLG
jgi:ABC-type glycerol-3-phosphate transport system substrate-binding protein